MDFKCNLQRIPFYKSDLVSRATGISAIIDSAAHFYVRQSSIEDRNSLEEMLEEDLQYINSFDVSTSILKLLALLSARSVLDFYRADLVQRLHCLMRPTATERDIFSENTEYILREELTVRRNRAVRLLIKTEFEKFKFATKSIFLRYKIFTKNLTNDEKIINSLLDIVPDDLITKRASLFEAIFKKTAKQKNEAPSMFIIE